MSCQSTPYPILSYPRPSCPVLSLADFSSFIHLVLLGQCDDILKAIPSQTDLKQSGFSMTAVTFEKDDDSHMRVIAAVGNLRAR